MLYFPFNFLSFPWSPSWGPLIHIFLEEWFPESCIWQVYFVQWAPTLEYPASRAAPLTHLLGSDINKLVLVTVEPLGTDTSLIWTPLYYRQFPMYRQNSHTFPLKKTSIIRTLSNTDNGHKISALGSKFKFFIMDTLGQGVNNLRYMYHFLSAVTQTLTLYQSAIPIPEQCLRQSILFCFKIRMYWQCSFWEVQ